MTRDQIIEAARVAGFQTGLIDYATGSGAMPFVTPLASNTCLPELERFAHMIRNQALDDAAVLCDEYVIATGRGLAGSAVRALKDAK